MPYLVRSVKLCGSQVCADTVLSTVLQSHCLGEEQPGTVHKSLFCTLYTVLVTQSLSVQSVAKLDSKRDLSLITGKVR